MSMSNEIKETKSNKYTTFFPSAGVLYQRAGYGFLFGHVVGFIGPMITDEAGSPAVARIRQGFRNAQGTGCMYAYYLPLFTCIRHSLAFSRGKHDRLNPFVSGAVIGALIARRESPMFASFAALLVGSYAALTDVSARSPPVPTATAPTHTGSQSPAGSFN